MKVGKMKVGLILFLTGLIFNSLKAQTADEIVNKYVETIGGKEKLAQINSIKMDNTTQVMGTEGPSTIIGVKGAGYRVESEVNGQKMIQVFTDKGGWQLNPFMGATTPTAMPEEMYKQGKSKLDLTGPLVNYSAKGYKVELLGKDGNAYKLKITGGDQGEMIAYVDTATYMMTKLTATGTFMGQSTEIASNFSNFKKGDLGITFPYQIEISYGGQFSITNTVNKIEINKPVDPKIFDMPK